MKREDVERFPMLCKTQVEIEWRRKRRVLEFVVEKGTAKFRAW